MKITVYTTSYEPTDEGDREVLSEWQEDHFFDNSAELIEFLSCGGLIEPSSSPEFHHSIWFADQPYQDPYLGHWTERSAHRDEASVSEAQWHEVWQAVVR